MGEESGTLGPHVVHVVSPPPPRTGRHSHASQMSASSLRGTFAPHRCRPATRCYFLLSLLLSCPPPPCEQRHPVRRTSARVTTAGHRRGLGTYMDEPLERVARRELSERFEPGRELARLTRPPRSCSPPACSGGSDCPPSTSVVASVVVDVIAPSSIRVRVPKQQSRQGYQLALASVPAKPTQPAHGAMRSAMSRVFKEQHGCVVKLVNAPRAPAPARDLARVQLPRRGGISL